MTEDSFWSDEDWGDELEWTPYGSSTSGTVGENGSTGDEMDAPIATGAQHVIVLIDCHSDMFGSDTSGDKEHPHEQYDTRSPIHLALQLCQQLLQERIQDTVKLKVGKRNGVGVLLYDTKPSTRRGIPQDSYKDDEEDEDDDDEDDDEEEEDPSTPRHVHALMDLTPPGITQVQTIRACLKGDRNVYTEFANTPSSSSSTSPSSRFLPLQTALEEAIRMFRHASCVRKPDKKSQELLDTKSIWILTNRAEPYQNQQDADASTTNDRDDVRKRLETVAHDCHENGIQIVLWPLFQTSKESRHNDYDTKTTQPLTDDSVFDMSAFYEGIVSQDIFQGQRHGNMEDICQGLDQLQSYWKKIRKLYWGPLLLPGQAIGRGDSKTKLSNEGMGHNDDIDPASGDPNVIMVDWFRFVQLAKKPNKVQIDQHTKRETIKMKQYLDHNLEIFATLPAGAGSSSTPRTSQPGLRRLRQFATLGGEDVPMSSEDMNHIRESANGTSKPNQPGLRLLGFKPSSAVPWYHSMNPVYLIYPNDSRTIGSRAAFSELRQAMIRKDVVGIGEVLHRAHWSSRMVALVPLPDPQVKDSTNIVGDLEDREIDAAPPGIMVMTLPFEDDVRTLDEDECYLEWRNQQSNLIKVEEIPDEVPSGEHTTEGMFVSPNLVEAAMNLISRHGLVDMRLGDDFENVALTEFYTYLEQVALELPVVMEKGNPAVFDTRPDDGKIADLLGSCIDDFRNRLPDELELLSSSRGTNNNKRKKELPTDDSGVDWHELYVSDELDTVKVPHLKSFLRSQGAPLSGNKASLLSRVTDLIKASMATSSNDAKVKVEV